jgi:hypothetical protein
MFPGFLKPFAARYLIHRDKVLGQILASAIHRDEEIFANSEEYDDYRATSV